MRLSSNNSYTKIIALYFLSIILYGCNKLVQVPPPTSTITTEEVFADSADAMAAVLGIYTKLAVTRSVLDFASGNLTVCGGLSSDELIDFLGSGSSYNAYYINQMQATNTQMVVTFWQPGYGIIYAANACINDAQASPTLSQSVKNQITGEAEFIRALCYFYLVNFFGDVPYANTTDYKVNALLARMPSDQVYNNITQDLISAGALLPAGYSVSGGQRIRANQQTALALLARVYLYRQKWDSAEAASTVLLNDPDYVLVNDPAHVYDANNSEAILQWNMNTNVQPFNATSEGYNMIPSSYPPYPNFYLSNQLLNAFEPGDLRRIAWVDSTTYQGKLYYYPYKYTIGIPNYQVGGTATQFYTVLRLAEQLLIRAEARAEQNTNLSGAIADLNTIRERAGLQDLPGTLTQTEVLAAIAQERRIEFFAEWGHRWLDLKRTGQLNAVMDTTTPSKIGGQSWNSYQALYPIPYGQLLLDPNLKQNPGY